MEAFTLVFFVLMLFVAALLVTQTIRRDFKSRERIGGGAPRESLHARAHAAQHALHPLQHHAHKSPAYALKDSER